MRGFAGYVLIGSIAAFAMCGATLAGLSLAVSGASPSQVGFSVHVERSQKGDRLELRTRIGREPVPNSRQATPTGCDPVFSPLSSVPRNPPGRCVA
jgi:hypothetical protein